MERKTIEGSTNIKEIGYKDGIVQILFHSGKSITTTTCPRKSLINSARLIQKGSSCVPRYRISLDMKK